MKESIAARVGRIISGGFHQIIDAVENAAPLAVMEQAIREVDGAIDEVRAELGKTLANKHLATRRLMDTSKRHDDLAGQIELAITQNREELAEAAVARQLDLEAQIPVLETTIKEAAEQEKELEGFIQALQAKKREMKEELSAFRKSREQAESLAVGGDGTTRGSAVEVKVTKAQDAFGRIIEKQTGLIGSEIDLKATRHLAELEDLSRKNRIQERLAAAKAKVKGT